MSRFSPAREVPSQENLEKFREALFRVALTMAIFDHVMNSPAELAIDVVERWRRDVVP